MCQNTTCENVFNFTQEDYPQEWQKMWDELRYAFINRRRKVDPFSGEFQWIYKGIHFYDGNLVHFFTHKKHPVTLRNEYYCVKISPEMEEVVNKFLEEKKLAEEQEQPIAVVLGQKIELVLM
jgi:hypothetical protein